MATQDFKIFKANRIGLSELYTDAINYIKKVYNANDAEFSAASPFAQLVNVIVNLGRMILFYIENSITEMNIETAYQSRSIIGLSQLTGHVPSRGMGARGSLYMSYNMNTEYAGQTIYIPNYTKLKNNVNGLTYLTIFPSEKLQLTVGVSDSQIEFPIIQGELKYQQGTGTGEAMQSFNFASKGDDIIDEFFCNVYVNSKRWKNVKSILDMSYEEEACIIKPSFNGGIDVFFGTGNNGKIPYEGSTVLLEYIVTGGSLGNLQKDENLGNWEFDGEGYDTQGNYVDLNSLYTLSPASDIIFGNDGESIEMTRQLAPHASRSFVLANSMNYKTFLTKLNMFSVIDVFSGFKTNNDKKIEEAYLTAKNEYTILKENYARQINFTGVNSNEAVSLKESMDTKRKEMDALKVQYDDTRMDDNIIYLYLIPDITKRLGDSDNYFTCPETKFKLTDDEKKAIIDLIDATGQQVLTVENRIIDPVYAKFAMNVFIQMWSNFDFNSVKSAIISAVSDYFIKNDRRDRIPVSDIISVIESVDGVDSVTVRFDADVNNQRYFGEGNYGIDSYGDVVLTRVMNDKFGNDFDVQDIHALFKGGFTSPSGVEYDSDLNSILGPINITLRGKTKK